MPEFDCLIVDLTATFQGMTKLCRAVGMTLMAPICLMHIGHTRYEVAKW